MLYLVFNLGSYLNYIRAGREVLKLFAVTSYITEMFLLKLEKVKYMFYKISESVKFTRIPSPCIPLSDFSKWH